MDILLKVGYQSKRKVRDLVWKLIKRNRFKTKEERIAQIKKNVWRLNEPKFQISKSKLEKLVWKYPMNTIGQLYNVSGNTVKKWCKKWGITTLPRGFWVKKK